MFIGEAVFRRADVAAANATVGLLNRIRFPVPPDQGFVDLRRSVGLLLLGGWDVKSLKQDRPDGIVPVRAVACRT